jgi:predicted nucleic acid-binding protein
MSYLLDVSALVARLWKTHEFHTRAKSWMEDKTLVVCPITELGFLRIATQAFGMEMDDAREILKRFLQEYKPGFIPCDLRALDGSAAPSGGKTTDFYLANLAQKHGLKWATLDAEVKHPAAFLIP